MERLSRTLFLVVGLLFFGDVSAPAQQQCGTVTTCPQASTPYSGAEIIYMVQGGVSKRAAVGSFASPWSSVNSVAFINLNPAPLPSPLIGTMVQIGQVDGVIGRMEIDTVGAPAIFTGTRVDGTRAVPVAVNAGDELASFNAWGYNGSAIVGGVAAFRTYAAEPFSAGHQGSYVRIATTAIGSTTLTDRLSVENDGGITTPPTVTGGDLGPGTINAAGLYVNGVAVTGAGITALTGDVTATGPGSALAIVNRVNGVVYGASPSTNTVPVVTGASTVTYEATPNAALANSSVTIGSTNVSLGATAASISGLSLVAPQLGTPAGVNLANAVGLPLATGVSGQLPLANGGSNASLIASNGGIAYSTASALAILPGTATASQCLLSGSNAAPSWGACSGGAAVTSIAGNTGAFTLSGLLTNSVNVLQVIKATAANFYAGASNDVLTSDNVFTPEVAVTFSATQTLDFSTFLNASDTLTGNITSLTCSNMKAGQAGVIRFIQDGTGTRTMVSTWCTAFVWPAGVKGTLSTPASTIDALFYQCVSTTVCLVSLGKAFL